MKHTLAQSHSPLWWKNGYVWLILGGPLAVILAGIPTVWLAVHGSDPIVAKDYYRRGLALGQQAAAAASPGVAPTGAGLPPPAMQPAQQARNHLASPVAGKP